MTRPVPPSSSPTGTDVGPAASRGAPGRVADVHDQTRRGLLIAAGFVVAAVVAGITRVGADWWLPMHLFVVGGLLSAISAATQMLAVTWSAAPAPRPLVAAGGLIAYVLGLLAIATMLPIRTRRHLRWAGPRVVQLAAGVAWWAAMTVALALATIRETDDRAILRALVIGGFAQILVASLAYLGPVLRGGGYERLTRSNDHV